MVIQRYYVEIQREFAVSCMSQSQEKSKHMKLGFSKPVTFVKIMPLFSDTSSLPSLFVQNGYLAIIWGVSFSGYWFSLFSTT